MTTDYAALMKKALLRLEQAERELREYREAAHEPVAIVGMACRFPGAANVAEYWRLLDGGVDAITETPRERWDLARWFDEDGSRPGKMAVRHGGFVERDSTVRRAASSDLAAGGAGDGPAAAAAARGGVGGAGGRRAAARAAARAARPACSSGMCSNDYAQLARCGRRRRSTPYAATGNALSVAAGRLVVLARAARARRGDRHGVLVVAGGASIWPAQSLRHGECDAGAGGRREPDPRARSTIAFAQAGMLSPRRPVQDVRRGGRRLRARRGLRRGGAEAAGATRGRDGDRMLAVIRGSAVNQDGREQRAHGAERPGAAGGDPRGAGASAAVARPTVDYVEAHGTGTPLGDPIEVAGARTRSYGRRRAGRTLLRIGSVKSNIGHLEAAAGVAG